MFSPQTPEIMALISPSSVLQRPFHRATPARSQMQIFIALILLLAFIASTPLYAENLLFISTSPVPPGKFTKLSEIAAAQGYRIDHRAAVVEDGSAGEINAHAAKGVQVARRHRHHFHALLQQLQHRLLRRAGVRDGLAVF